MNHAKADHLTVLDVRRLAASNYERGGDYILEMLNDKEIFEVFCRLSEKEGRKKLYDFMKGVMAMRKYCERIA